MKNLISIFLVFGWLNGHTQHDIVSAEYFINSDPGFGNGTNVNVNPGQNIDIEFEVPLQSLSTGFNVLHTRVYNSNDKWSLSAKKPFYVIGNSTGNTLTAAEFFINEDPGFGNATPLAISPSTSINETFALPLDDLLTGFNMLFIRVKDNNEKWSLYARKQFFVTPLFGIHDIVAAEYFIDLDPGVGEAEPLSVTPEPSIDTSWLIEIPETLSDGEHRLHIRVLNSAGRWSVYAAEMFEINLDVSIPSLKNQFSFYPNPTTGGVFFETGEKIVLRVDLIDMNGKLVLSESPSQKFVDLSALAPGNYLIQVTTNNTATSRLIVKQ